MLAQGERLRTGVQQVIDAHGIGDTFSVFGKASCLYYGTRDAAGEPSQAFRTLFLQETITRGLLAPSFVISYAHRTRIWSAQSRSSIRRSRCTRKRSRVGSNASYAADRFSPSIGRATDHRYGATS